MGAPPPADARRLRERLEDDLAAGRWGLARQHAAALWDASPTMAVAGHLLRCRERMRPHAALVPFRVAILRSFTVEPLVPLLQAGGLAGGLDLDVHVGGFNAYAQEILDAESALYRHRPAMVVLAVQAGDLGAAIDRAPADFRSWVEAFRARTDASLVVHELAGPEGRAVNAELRRLAAAHPGVFVMPFGDLAAGGGEGARNQAAMGMPLANESLVPLVRRWLGFVHPLSGRVCKVLVTDLDNTLWGGVLGEDGPEGIAIHHEMQQALLDLHRRGILLAVASRNDEADALAVLARHAGMALRPEHFSALRINWRDKPANLREIAGELSLGIDALAFLDDDPVELDRVRGELPEVTVIDATRGAAAVREHPVFARLTLSAEDLARQRHYADQRARRAAQEQAPSLEAFYHSLGQEVVVERMSRETAERAAQLTQKTNQFNLTGRRYTSAELLRMAEGGAAHVFTVRVKDVYGDNGLTGLAIVRDAARASEIDTFLLSCRVLARGVEVALLAFLCDRARALGKREVRGRFVPTARNAPAADFFARHGFEARADEWVADPARAGIACPPWIRLTVAETALA